MWPWFLLVGFLGLPFAIWLSLVLVGIVVSSWSLFPLWACKMDWNLCPYSSKLRSESTAGRSLTPGGLCTEGCGVSWLPVANGSRKTSVPAAPLILCPVSLFSLLNQTFFSLCLKTKHIPKVQLQIVHQSSQFQLVAGDLL